jgi:molybdate transport repressor ModE-like protein
VPDTPAPRRGRHGLSSLQRVLDPLRVRLVMELARHGSITRAADACGVGQPTASAHLRTLEAAAGVRLYESTPRGTRLTDAGLLLARQASAIMATLDDLDQGLGKLVDGVTGTLRLAVCEEFGVYALPRILAPFVADRPHADVHVRFARSGEVARLVQRGEAELGIAGELRRPPGVRSEPLVSDALICVVGHASGDPEDLPLLVPIEGSSTRAVVELWLEAERRRPRVIELDSVEAVKRSVAIGMGFAFISRMAIVAEVARGELRRAQFGRAVLERRIDVLRAADRRPTVLANAFEQAVRRAPEDRVVANLSRRTGPAGRPQRTQASDLPMAP